MDNNTSREPGIALATVPDVVGSCNADVVRRKLLERQSALFSNTRDEVEVWVARTEAGESTDPETVLRKGELRRLAPKEIEALHAEGDVF